MVQNHQLGSRVDARVDVLNKRLTDLPLTCCARFLVPKILSVVTSDQDLGAGLVETLLMLAGGGMSGQPGQQPPSGES